MIVIRACTPIRMHLMRPTMRKMRRPRSSHSHDHGTCSDQDCTDTRAILISHDHAAAQPLLHEGICSFMYRSHRPSRSTRIVIDGCSLQALQDRLDSGNLPPKEVARAKANDQKESPDDISECSSDTLQFGLLAFTVQGRDIHLVVKCIVRYRNFCNKL